MTDINELKSLGLYNGASLVPIKIYCSNFSRRKLGVLFCNKELAGFLIKYLPDDIVWDMGTDKDNIIYIVFTNKLRKKGKGQR